MSDQPVYSTKTGSSRAKGRATSQNSSYKEGSGPIKIRLESKGRGGKLVTVLWNFPFAQERAKLLMKGMQAEFGCGATIRGSAVELQGDRRDQVEQFLAKEGLTVKRAGG